MTAACRLTAWGHYLAVIAVVVLTRGPLWGYVAGEPDTARYVFGLRFWTEIGPDAPSIINRELSSGYYWLAATLARLADVPYAEFPRLLSTVSVAAALVTGPALYRLGTHVVSRTAALVSTIALLLGPGWWWSGFQAHPQGLAMALQLLSMVAFLEAWRRRPARASPPWLVLSGLGLVASLLVKSDAILLFPAYAGLRLFQRATQQALAPVDSLGRSALVTGALLGGAYAAFTTIHKAITGPLPAVAVEATAHIGRFLIVPMGRAALEQLAPVVFSPGPAVLALVTMAATACVVRAGVARRRAWLILIAAWSVPGYLFWLSIAGNNARHVILAPVPIFWLAFTWLEHAGLRRMVTVTSLAIAGNLLVPANSGPSLYPSANVPRSVALMRDRQAELRLAARRLVSGTAASACYVGRTTQDYVTQYVLEYADAGGYRVELLPSEQLRLALHHPDGRLFRRIDVIGLRGRQDVGINPRRWPDCGLVESLEYDETGRRQRFFGTEGALFNWLVGAVQSPPPVPSPQL